MIDSELGRSAKEGGYFTFNEEEERLGADGTGTI